MGLHVLLVRPIRISSTKSLYPVFFILSTPGYILTWYLCKPSTLPFSRLSNEIVLRCSIFFYSKAIRHENKMDCIRDRWPYDAPGCICSGETPGYTGMGI